MSATNALPADEITWEALQSLPPHLRRVIVLREIEGLLMAEVAEHLGLSRGLTERRWMRAVVLMSERLARLGAIR